MIMKLLFPLALLFLVLSCDKDDDIIMQDKPQESVVEETYTPDFQEKETQLRVSIKTSAGIGQPTTMSQYFNFKLGKGFSENGQYFYELCKKSDYKYIEGAKSFPWTETELLYRYDYTNQKSYFYEGVNDPDPKLLMNFDLELCDTILLDSSLKYKHIYFVLTGKSDFMTSDQKILPSLTGDILINQGYKTTITLTPLNPSPLFIEHQPEYYLDHDWTKANFGGWLNTYNFVDYLYITSEENELFLDVGW